MSMYSMEWNFGERQVRLLKSIQWRQFWVGRSGGNWSSRFPLESTEQATYHAGASRSPEALCIPSFKQRPGTNCSSVRGYAHVRLVVHYDGPYPRRGALGHAVLAERRDVQVISLGDREQFVFQPRLHRESQWLWTRAPATATILEIMSIFRLNTCPAGKCSVCCRTCIVPAVFIAD